MVVQLIEQWDVPGTQNPMVGLNPVESAASAGHPPTLQYLLDRAAAGIYNSASGLGVLLEVIMACKGSPQVLQVLLDRPDLTGM
jgi:hypothetical protein